MDGHPDWCWPADCSVAGRGGAHLSRPVEVHSDRTGLLGVVRLAHTGRGAYVSLVLCYPDYGPDWEAEEVPLCFDGGFARVLGRVLVNAGREACARGCPQAVDNGWG